MKDFPPVARVISLPLLICRRVGTSTSSLWMVSGSTTPTRCVHAVRCHSDVLCTVVLV